MALERLAPRVPTIAVKRGAGGAAARVGDTTVFAETLLVGVVDTTGAGDSFDAGFLFGHLSGFDLRKSLTVANACGALSTQGLGGTATQADWDEIQRFVRKQAQSL